MKNFFIFLCTHILAFVKWLLGIVRDISSIIREGDKNSAISSRRFYAGVFVVMFIYSISIAIRMFTDLLQYGWIAALIFIPSVLCGVFAAVYSYFASIGDIKDTLKELKGILDTTKK